MHATHEREAVASQSSHVCMLVEATVPHEIQLKADIIIGGLPPATKEWWVVEVEFCRGIWRIVELLVSNVVSSCRIEPLAPSSALVSNDGWWGMEKRGQGNQPASKFLPEEITTMSNPSGLARAGTIAVSQLVILI